MPRIIFFLLLLTTSAIADNNCDGISKLPMPNATITSAEAFAGGIFAPPSGAPITGLPAFCRVAATLRPTSTSDIRIEVWLPQAGWNGRLEGTGNGGFAGKVSYGALANGVN